MAGALRAARNIPDSSPTFQMESARRAVRSGDKPSNSSFAGLSERAGVEQVVQHNAQLFFLLAAGHRVVVGDLIVAVECLRHSIVVSQLSPTRPLRRRLVIG